jgi:uncharacterized delta-60 repeat protein
MARVGGVPGRSCGLAAVAALSLIAASPAAGQAPGSLDPDFGNFGFATAPLGSWVGAVASLTKPTGKIVTVGETEIGGRQLIASALLRPDGSLVSSFGDGGWATVDIGGAATGNAIARQPDGKLVLAGTGRHDGTGPLSLTAVRLRPNGQLDRTFGHGGITTIPVGREAIATGLAIQANGKIVLTGTSLTDAYRFTVARLNPDGSVDRGFGDRGVSVLGRPAVAWGMAMQPDGRYVVAGHTIGGGRDVYAAVRMRRSGELDRSFGDGGEVLVPIGTDAYGLAVAVQPDGKLLLTGSTVGPDQVATIRLLPNGSADPSFGSAGIAAFPGAGVNAIAVQPDGKVLLAGVGASLVRLEPNGLIDRTFGNQGAVFARIGTDDAANGVSVQRNGMIVLAGAATISGRIVQMVVRVHP